MTEPTQPADQTARDAIIFERERNVAVLAGAGTGKTQTIIARAVELLAPRDEAAKPLPIQRMALITFTRRAAGELRFRIREQLLRELERAARQAPARALRLRDALGNLDAAFIGTIHGFADRLLRLRPVEAELSPAYVLLDDTTDLVRETLWRLRRGAEAADLRATLAAHADKVQPAGLINEAAETLRAAARAGVAMQRGDGPFGPIVALETILTRMIETRDIDVDLPSVLPPDLAAGRAAVAKLGELVGRLRGRENGHRQLRRIARHLARIETIDDPAEVVRLVSEALPRRGLLKGRDFGNDAMGWGVWKTVDPENPSSAWILDKLKESHRWLAARFVRLFPVVNALFEQVKSESEVVDYLDLLVKLRNLLRDPRQRRFYQSQFDHIFVDEFQDTDPLQCEIVFYLCEMAGSTAERWDAVKLQPGKLTIVGDPKQSIYRFRRADIAMYGTAIERLKDQHALEQRLDTNFRSRPPLIDFFNQQLAAVLGKAGSEPFDAVTGRANYEDLSPSQAIASRPTVVHELPYADASDSGLLAIDGRPIEAQMLARYVRWLIASGFIVRDPDSGRDRPVELGDIAVLANVTTQLPLLLRALDDMGLEYSARGGALFLAHPAVRQYLMALRGLADPDDGIAEATLLRPPFFSVSLADQVAAVASKKGQPQEDGRTRVAEARAVIQELRRQRLQQAPGATARDLIERSALGRNVVTARNGRQTLAALYEVAAEIDRRASLDGLDFDAISELARSWANDPIFIEAPEPTASRVMRVLTIHSAKGLEFPVVILWDGFQTLHDRHASGWLVERSGNAWALGLGSIAIEYPRGGHLGDREKQFGEQESRRKYYVAATRARDLLVLPLPLTRSRTLPYATAVLAGGSTASYRERFETYRSAAVPPWASIPVPSLVGALRADADLQDRADDADRDFGRVLSEATRPIATPTAVTSMAQVERREDVSAAAGERRYKVAQARFGARFGITVHRALELVLTQPGRDVDSARALAIAESGLAEDLAEAQADVARALETLRQNLSLGSPDIDLACEYPIVQAASEGRLLTGFVDLLIRDADTLTVIDLKTDAVIPGPLEVAYPEYARQLGLYAEMLRAAGVVGERRLRCGLLFTATGELRWATG